MKKYMTYFCLFLLIATPLALTARGGGAFLGGALLGTLAGTAIGRSSQQPEVVYVQQAPAPSYEDSYADEPDDNDYTQSDDELIKDYE